MNKYLHFNYHKSNNTIFNDSPKFLKVINPKINVYKILYLIYRFNTHFVYFSVNFYFSYIDNIFYYKLTI